MTRKKTKSKFNTSLILAVAAFAIVCYFFVSFFNLRMQISETREQVDALKRQVTAQLQENERLEKQLDGRNFDAFVEQRARDEDFGYVYPDERVYYDMAAGQ